MATGLALVIHPHSITEATVPVSSGLLDEGKVKANEAEFWGKIQLNLAEFRELREGFPAQTSLPVRSANNTPHEPFASPSTAAHFGQSSTRMHLLLQTDPR